MTVAFAPRRATFLDITADGAPAPLPAEELASFETFDMIYRSLCALLYNYVPTSGHPGGSISSGRFVAALLLDTMEYELADPDREDADIVSYAAGHKAMGLYAMWALRDEIARAAGGDLLPADVGKRLRLEDLLGFRRNPITATTLFRRFGSKALDGHPTPATPFVKLSTGASGVGVASSIGLGFGARDRFGASAPRVHVIEGEGGLTPGRVAEALAAAGTASLDNVVFHIDWNQASIDSDRACRDGDGPGDYVQWTRANCLPARLERCRRARRPRLAADRRSAASRARARHRPAHGDRLPHAQGLEVRRHRKGVPRRRSQLCADGFYAAWRS